MVLLEMTDSVNYCQNRKTTPGSITMNLHKAAKSSIELEITKILYLVVNAALLKKATLDRGTQWGLVFGVIYYNF